MKLTINEVARSLDLPLSTVERWIRQGRIPIDRSGHTFSFDRSVLEKWAKLHNLAFSTQDVAPESDIEHRVGSRISSGHSSHRASHQASDHSSDHSSGQSSDQGTEGKTLVTAMKRGGVHYDIRGGSVDEILTSAVEVVTGFPAARKTELRERLLERERLTSTGIGKGIAIPHPRTPFSDEIERPVIVTCFLKTPIDYLAVDKKPVFILFILLSPTPKEHLQILSRLSFCLRDDGFVAFLRETPDRDAFFEKIERFEEKLDPTGMI